MKAIGILMSLMIGVSAMAADGGGTVGSDKIGKQFEQLINKYGNLGQAKYVGVPKFSLDQETFDSCKAEYRENPEGAESLMDLYNEDKEFLKDMNKGKKFSSVAKFVVAVCKDMGMAVDQESGNEWSVVKGQVLFEVSKWPNHYLSCNTKLSAGLEDEKFKYISCSNMRKSGGVMGAGDGVWIAFPRDIKL